MTGRLYSLKKVHVEPATMNNEVNKRKRATYVNTLNRYIQQGRQVIWLDETNFNLFCRRTKGRSRIGERAVQKVPASRGKNIHLLGAISATGKVLN